MFTIRLSKSHSGRNASEAEREAPFGTEIGEIKVREHNLQGRSSDNGFITDWGGKLFVQRN